MYQLMDYHTEQGHKSVLVGPRGRTLMPILIMEPSGLTVRKVPFAEDRYLKEMELPPRSRNIQSVVRRFRAFGNKNGMTKAAKTFLREATAA